jgi:hypothetical protein
MKKRFTDQQIAYAMRQLEQGATVPEKSRQLSVSKAKVY